MGTIGGNVANASPIGDLPPILLALEARIHLRHCDTHIDENANGHANNSADSKRNEQSCTDEIIPLSEFS